MNESIIHNKYVFKFFAEVNDREMPNNENENILVHLYDNACWNPEHSLEESDGSIVCTYFKKTHHGNFIIISCVLNNKMLSLKAYRQDVEENNGDDHWDYHDEEKEGNQTCLKFVSTRRLSENIIDN